MRSYRYGVFQLETVEDGGAVTYKYDRSAVASRRTSVVTLRYASMISSRFAEIRGFGEPARALQLWESHR